MKKRAFHCEKCGNACTIYKKGKKHRVLVCSQCGVIASNPLPLALLAAAAPALIEGATSLLSKKSEQTNRSNAPPRVKALPNHSPTKAERYVNLALGGKC